MIRFGFISEMDTDKGLARVTFRDDKIVSPWMPVSVANTKDTKFSLPMALDEHVWCLMTDNGETGIIGGAVYSKASQPELTGGKVGVSFADGSKVYFENGKLTIEAQGEVEITAAPRVKINGNLEVAGNIDASGLVKALAGTPGVVSLSTHIHPTPSGPSSPPTPGT
jgi:phage baseplate assembly protein gpV